MLRKLKDFQPGTAEVHELKILLHGPIGAGKSSLINSINTVLQGYNTAGALAASSAGQSFTLKLKFHKLKKGGPGTFYPFVFADIMGLEPEESNGVQTEDMIKILQGRIKDGYTQGRQGMVAPQTAHPEIIILEVRQELPSTMKWVWTKDKGDCRSAEPTPRKYGPGPETRVTEVLQIPHPEIMALTPGSEYTAHVPKGQTHSYEHSVM
ncbi:hypothetical protein PGIGA_G00157700 [Pangasianodon gigas]|uniref:Uncharacterized protein n=1 Tax=Pangasianodon gigas TaxID=30993 RepID=A0ACC5XR75_PANGG|nr:hypothetical protein [Pangasianodon gigas]